MAQAATRKYEDDKPHKSGADEQQVSDEKSEQTVIINADSSTVENNQDEPYYHYTVDTKDPDPWLIKHKLKIIGCVAFILISVAGFIFYKSNKLSAQTYDFVSNPQLNDLYYIDFRIVKDNLRPAEKFRMARVKDITGDVITINFSSYFYMQEHELNEAIRYAQLRYEKFFQEKRHNYKISELKSMIESGAIVLVRRPEGNMLDGNVVVPDSHFEKSSVFIPGKKENFTGLEHLKFLQESLRAEQAFAKFQESANLGFAEGQVNLAQMYLMGTGIEKDLYESLSLLKQASLQSYEPAILKYGIVCEQVESCMITDFYEELIQSGVNIEFTKQADIRATTKAFEKALIEAEEKAAKKANM